MQNRLKIIKSILVCKYVTRIHDKLSNSDYLVWNDSSIDVFMKNLNHYINIILSLCYIYVLPLICHGFDINYDLRTRYVFLEYPVLTIVKKITSE